MRYADKLLGVFQRLHSATRGPGAGVAAARGEKGAVALPEKPSTTTFTQPTASALGLNRLTRRAERHLASVTGACALAVMAIGLAVLVGWIFRSEPLKSVFPGSVTMKFNTALTFVLAGAALRWRDRRGLRIGLGILVAVAGALTLGEYCLGRDFGIDQIFIYETGQTPQEWNPPGRMSPATALGFVFCGGAIALLGVRRGWEQRLVEALVLLASTIGTLSLIGYATGAQALYSIPGYLSVAFLSAVAFVLLGSGILCALPESLVVLVLRSRGSARALWWGFGMLTILLALAGVVNSFRSVAIETNVEAQADVARFRSDVARELEVDVLHYTLDVRAFVGGDAGASRRMAEHAAEVARYLARYERLAETPQQRELAVQFVALWRELHAQGEALMAAGHASQEKLAQMADLGFRLERIVDREMQPEAAAAFEDRRAATQRSIHGTQAVAAAMLVTGAVIALVTGSAVARAVLGGEEALRESEERFRTMFELAAVGMAYGEVVTGRFHSVNAEYCEITGYTAAELCGMSFRDLTHPKERDRDWQEYQRALHAPAGTYQVEKRYLRKDGSLVWVRVSAAVVERDAKGKPLRAIAAVEDITGRKQAEAALAANLRHLENVNLVSRVIEKTLDLDEMVREVVRRMREVFDADRVWFVYPCDPEAPSYRVPIEATHPDCPGAFAEGGEYPIDSGAAALMRNLLATDEPVAFDKTRPHPGPMEVLERFNIRAQMMITIRPRVGKAWLLGLHQCSYDRVWTEEEQRLLRDIAYRLRDGFSNLLIYRELKESEERFRATFEQAAVGIAHVGLGGEWLRMNDRLCEILGYSREELLQHPFQQLVHTEERDQHAGIFRQLLEGTLQKYAVEERYQRKDGSYVWVNLTTTLTRRSDTAPVYFILVIEDISERKRMEEGRKQLLQREQTARAAAEAANRIKDQFLSVVSHELRTPLTPVLAALDLLDAEPALSVEAATSLRMIRANIEMEARLISDLLDLTRVQQAKFEIKQAPADAHDALRRALGCFEHEIRTKHLQVDLELHAQHTTLFADGDRLLQIFWNLIGNAVKFTPDGGRIEVCTINDEAGKLRVMVSDTGIGMTPAIMSRLFDAFEQGEQTLTRRYGGLGLGLTISKALVEMHGGELTATSKGPGSGSAFSTIFPLLTLPRTEETPPALPTSSGLPPAKQRRILLVEDNPDTLTILVKLLQRAGHIVSTATCVSDALEVARREHPNLLVSDIGLPDASGWELLRELRKERSIPAVAISGFGTPDDQQKSREAGFARHLIKPINYQALKDVIAEVFP